MHDHGVDIGTILQSKSLLPQDIKVIATAFSFHSIQVPAKNTLNTNNRDPPRDLTAVEAIAGRDLTSEVIGIIVWLVPGCQLICPALRDDSKLLTKSLIFISS